MRILALALVLAACSSQSGDPHSIPNPNVLGPDARLRDVQNPAAKLAGTSIKASSVVVTAVDNFDETHDGKSRGTVFVQDADQGGPFAGVSLYAPSFQPTSLRLGPGDVVDLSGQYVEQTTIGSTVNFAPNFLPQMNKPLVTFRFELSSPRPTVVPIADLVNFSTARRWIGQLITVQNVQLVTALAGDSKMSGRITANLTGDANAPQIDNELYDLQITAYPAGTKFSSITGVCNFFFNIKIAPRSADDLVP